MEGSFDVGISRLGCRLTDVELPVYNELPLCDRSHWVRR